MQRADDGDNNLSDTGSSRRGPDESLKFKLAYNLPSVGSNGCVLTRGQKSSLRGKEGFCRTCPGVPVQLFLIKKNAMNPLRVTKQPLDVKGKCANGICFSCYPEKDLERSSRSTKRLYPSSTTTSRSKTTMSLPVGTSVASSLRGTPDASRSPSTPSYELAETTNDDSSRSDLEPSLRFQDILTEGSSEMHDAARSSDTSEVSQLSASFHTHQQSQRRLLKVFQGELRSVNCSDLQ